MRIRVPKIDRLLYSYPEDDLTHLNWRPASKLKLSRNSETPCIIGQGSPQLSHLESTDHKPSTYHPLQCTLTNRRMTRTHADHFGGLSRRSDELQGLLSEEAKVFLINLLRRSEGRKRYMDWLFRLVRLIWFPSCVRSRLKAKNFCDRLT